MNKTTLEIIVDALNDAEWNELRLRADARRASHASNIYAAKRSSAIEFGDWILKHTISPSHDADGFACWIVNGTETFYTTYELYNAYLNGDFEPDDDDDLADWEITLTDGLEDLDS